MSYFLFYIKLYFDRLQYPLLYNVGRKLYLGGRPSAHILCVCSFNVQPLQSSSFSNLHVHNGRLWPKQLPKGTGSYSSSKRRLIGRMIKITMNSCIWMHFILLELNVLKKLLDLRKRYRWFLGGSACTSWMLYDLKCKSHFKIQRK